jgi:hypothetical protein
MNIDDNIMEEAILNSLLRYSNQLTPSRDTYPLPGKDWTSGLRQVDPPVNLSTYYLIDKPSLTGASALSYRLPSSASTSAVSPQKRFINKSSPDKSRDSKNNHDEISKKILKPQSPIKKIGEKQENEKNKPDNQKKKLYNGKKTLEPKKNSKEYESSKEFEDYKRQQDELVKNMQQEIDMLKDIIEKQNDIIKNLEVNETGTEIS